DYYCWLHYRGAVVF
nr:immunoglobulin light chain junction region [Macaca mulatta]MOW05205.1 immunoglobulin light chain junction region [Macaca mulatta]